MHQADKSEVDRARNGLLVTLTFATGYIDVRMWAGDRACGIEPWRDTGVEIRGCAIAEMEGASAQMWASSGKPTRDGEFVGRPPPAGDISQRIVESEPATAVCCAWISSPRPSCKRRG
jgi:hypothetical protein